MNLICLFKQNLPKTEFAVADQRSFGITGKRSKIVVRNKCKISEPQMNNLKPRFLDRMSVPVRLFPIFFTV